LVYRRNIEINPRDDALDIRRGWRSIFRSAPQQNSPEHTGREERCACAKPNRSYQWIDLLGVVS
jgi:hypothetical protein